MLPTTCEEPGTVTGGRLAGGLAALRARLEGELVTPGDRGWDDARQTWNLAVDQRPELVVFPAGPEDVVAAVEYANGNGLAVAAQGTGHGAAARGSLEGSLLLNMARLARFEIDPARGRVRVEPGATWGPVAEGAGEHGLAGLAACAPDVGVVGHALGGGLGWLARRHGLAANSVRALEVVTAGGARLRVDGDHDPALFWALRGGGGSFAVVTAMELELFPISTVQAGLLAWPVEQARTVIGLYDEWVDTVPDDLTSLVRILHRAPAGGLSESMTGTTWVVVEAVLVGSDAAGEELLEPLRRARPAVDTFRARRASRLNRLHADPPRPTALVGHGGLLRELTAHAVDDLVEVAGGDSRTSVSSIELRHLGGALSRPQAGYGALAALEGRYALFAVGTPRRPEHAAIVERDVQAVLDALAPCSSSRDYLNFRGREGDAGHAFSRELAVCLRAVKAAFDPGELIRSSHSVEPGA